MTGTARVGPPQPKRPAPPNEPSRCLSDDDNQKLFKLFEPNCKTLSSAVVQVFLADPPSLNRWNKRCCGVATLIKDSNAHSYFIQVYDIRNDRLIWKQELYNQFKYRTPRPHFHSFDTDDCPAGLNFADVTEAQTFRDAVQRTLQRRNVRKVDKKVPTMTPSNSSSSLRAAMPKPNSVMSKSMTNLPVEVKKTKKDKEKKKKKLTKDDIGIPTGFTHLSHIGWDPNKGYDTNNLDPSLKTLFDKAGVSSEQLNDQDTATFIYDFIEKQGGMDAVKQEETKSPPPGRGRAPPPPTRGPAVPPPLPNRGPVPTPTPPRGNAPPPPPPPSVGGPIPPPPPPIVAPPPAAPTSQAAPKPAVPSLSSALQDQIHRGMKLKPVDGAKREPTGRNALLNDIQNQNFGLRPAPAAEESGREPPEGLAGALAKALAARNKQIHDSDAEDDSSDNDDDEFDNDDNWD